MEEIKEKYKRDQCQAIDEMIASNHLENEQGKEKRIEKGHTARFSDIKSSLECLGRGSLEGGNGRERRWSTGRRRRHKRERRSCFWLIEREALDGFLTVDACILKRLQHTTSSTEQRHIVMGFLQLSMILVNNAVACAGHQSPEREQWETPGE